MKAILLALLVASIYAEMLVTKEYTDYLKRHVSWEVAEYEENVFRGWTVEEAKNFLGAILPEEFDYIPSVEAKANLPGSLSWAEASCDHGVRNQGNCGSCWAFAVSGMLSDRCCLQGHDHGWLAPQDLVSCDKHSQGCNGGWCTWALDYVISAGGLVDEACFPYKAQNVACAKTCADGSPLKRYCNCVGGYKICDSVEKIKTCLASGPIAVAFGVCNSFFSYKGGIYKCDCNGRYAGLHAVLAMGFADAPECHWTVRNSWGTGWGKAGYFDIGCKECGMDGKYPQGNVMCEKVEP
ncbi:MAG: C1 family peptidase [Methanomicrobiales archaeon]